MKKKPMNKMSPAKKKWLIVIGSAVLAIAVGCGIWYGVTHSSSDPVPVFPFDRVGMTEYWGDSKESYGPVTTDKIQTVFLSDTQEVTEVLVKAGDTVKKGDLLMSFDTTLGDLELEKKRLDVEKLKLQLEDAKKELKKINGMRPMRPPQPEPDEDEDRNLGTALTDPYQISAQKKFDGSSPEKALICWLNSNNSVDDGVFEAIRSAAEEYQNYNAEQIPDPPADAQAEGDPTDPDNPEQPSDPIEPTEPEPIRVDTYYVVFKVTQGNMSLGNRQVWQALKVTRSGSGFRFRFADAVISDHMTVDSGSGETVNKPDIDFGSGFTAAQIAQMRSEQEKKIKDLEFQIKMSEATYKIAQAEMNDGNVYAQIDGEVVSLLDPEEAKQTMQPMLKVSGGGGFYIEGFVNDIEKDQLVIGQEVTVNDWNSGMTYVGTIRSIGVFPTDRGYYNGMGNPNASYFPFRVYVDGSANLQEGQYASMTYSSGSSENGVYLENPFLRTEGGKSYVYVLGENGTLEKRFVTTGKSLWGSYTQITSGITVQDMFAFPYGKNVKPGVKAAEGDISELYR